MLLRGKRESYKVAIVKSRWREKYIVAKVKRTRKMRESA